jgi:hypothetical protein
MIAAVLAVLVGSWTDPTRRQAVDERLRRIELGFADPFLDRKFELLRIDELVGESHHREHDGVPDDLDRRQVLGVARDELRDPRAARLTIASRNSAYARSPPLAGAGVGRFQYRSSFPPPSRSR